MPQGPLAATIAKNTSNAQVALQLDQQGALGVGQAHGKYYASSKAKRTFGAANLLAGAALSAGLATTYTGFCLSNPAGSGKNLVVQKVSGIIIVAPAAVLALGLIKGFAAGGITAHTTPIVGIASEFIGDATASIAKADAACTLVGTPVFDRWLAGNAASAGLFGFLTDIDGEIVIPPGGYLAIGANVAGPAAGLVGSMTWEELPV